MSTWSREELTRAFERYTAAVEESAASGDWEPFVQCFHQDATYVEHAYGRFAGHEEIRRWVSSTMGSFPGNEMVAFPARWVVVDEEHGWVIAEIRNLMRDPGDGSTIEASNLTILRYGGQGLWAEEEDVYNPSHFLEMATAYLRRCAALGTLSDEAAAWASRMRIDLRDARGD